eukprot:TRINITY_DN24008_c0_g1_i1.p2 TRINITY_DN24008_c0_g1~~TRINITY_DN24008_c0_g1_i1.p2  ORF type:complete len:109 (+),score=29.65 TRINITY_DN24008_c0_g1_i1:53-379(+)
MSLTLHVRSPAGDLVTVDVDGKATVREMKQQVADALQIPNPAGFEMALGEDLLEDMGAKVCETTLCAEDEICLKEVPKPEVRGRPSKREMHRMHEEFLRTLKDTMKRR